MQTPNGELGYITRMRVTFATMAGSFGTMALVTTGTNGIVPAIWLFVLASLCMFFATTKELK